MGSYANMTKIEKQQRNKRRQMPNIQWKDDKYIIMDILHHTEKFSNYIAMQETLK